MTIPRPLKERLLAKAVLDENGCLLWTGTTTRGYGYIGAGARSAGVRKTHRAMYELLIGPIPKGLVIDHLCRVRNCMNPFHLEPVTSAENSRRRGLAVTHCPQGHERPQTRKPNGRRRECNVCKAARSRRNRAAAKAVAA
jgi:hypothetical protein